MSTETDTLAPALVAVASATAALDAAMFDRSREGVIDVTAWSTPSQPPAPQPATPDTPRRTSTPPPPPPTNQATNHEPR
ncbi:hypothetical protein [Rhodococcus qingshengii]|uniref:hypothetical protein n=1 Tax=Rhodococcus qingshengii TaxID=334542 RepID=UPI002034E672|nr:hypothetical protein [Rhodococcus qingshengii]